MEKKVEWPMDVAPFFDEARDVVLRVLKHVPLMSAILDDWNAGQDTRGIDLKGPRIIWGMSDCSAFGCGSCRLLNLVGVDVRSELVQDHVHYFLRGALCCATEEHMSFLPERCQQKYLSCKTIEQYKSAFVAFVLKRCNTEEEMHAELAWIFGFRLLYLNEDGVGFDRHALLVKECAMRREIIGRVMNELVRRGDMTRIRWLFINNCSNEDFEKAIAGPSQEQQ
ncbi:hypothetical protein HY932_03625 [Candidatus Falkowbacteria bacterium]|nr:hypothetical protein [Candidatus Falkowbacteria bacterium]